jgi:Holliday junction resolvase RusA-like endonuclease
MYPDKIYLSCPFPPSANRIWRAVGGKNIKSKEYRDWKAEAEWRLALQMPKGGERPIWLRQLPLSLTIALTPSDDRKWDIDNRIKPVCDALQGAGWFKDDSQIHHLIVMRLPKADERACQLMLCRSPSIEFQSPDSPDSEPRKSSEPDTLPTA